MLMIVSHSGFAQSIGVNIYINAFYMPMFFLISGYFINVEKYTLVSFAQKKIKSLLVPYFIWGIFHLIIWMLMYNFRLISISETPVKMLVGLVWDNNSHLPIAGALWFLSCLFMISMFAFINIKLFGGCIYLMISIIIAVIGVYVRIFIPWSCDSALVANSFFAIGYFMRDRVGDITRFVNRNKQLILGIFLFAFFCTLAYVNGFTNIRTCSYGKVPGLYIFNACAGTISAFFFAAYLYGSNRLKQIKTLFAYIGRYSMPFLCLNQLFFAVSSRVLGDACLWQFVQAIMAVVTIGCFNCCMQKTDKGRRLYGMLFGR